MKKKVLMACCNYWKSPFQVGSHQIAKCFLEKGWQVAFVSSPISPLHFLRGVDIDLKKRYREYNHGGNWDENHQLFTYVPGAIITPAAKPALDSEFVINNWYKFSIPNVVNKLKENGFGTVDLLYLDSMYQGFWLNEIKYKKSIFRVADKNSAFSTALSNAKKIERYIAGNVDVVVYSASNLKEYIDEMNPKMSFHLPNGVNFEHFNKGNGDMPTEFKDIKKPIVLYVGAMHEWFDYEMVLELAKNFPHVSFVLIGNNEMLSDRENNLDNVYVLGRRAYEELPRYIKNSQIGIIPFKVSKYPELVNSINPLKLYEYMAGGLPVIASSWGELEKINSPALLYKNRDEAIALLKRLLSNIPKEELYINYARKNTWNEKVETLIKKIDI